MIDILNHQYEYEFDIDSNSQSRGLPLMLNADRKILFDPFLWPIKNL